MIRTSALSLTLTTLLASVATSAIAQEAPAPQDAPPAAQPSPVDSPDPSTDAMTNLVRLLVAKGTITRDEGEQLLRKAQAEAGEARAANGNLTPPPPGTVRVPYVPETVRNQIRDEIKTEVLKQAQAEGWASPKQQAPEWTKRVRFSGDVRFRGEQDLFSKDNANDIIDYAAINATPGGFDFFKNINNVPIINTRENRDRLRIRARIGAEFDLNRNAMVAVKLATGDDTSPISTNQVLGGGLGKKNIWLDQAYFRLSMDKWPHLSTMFGRFPNPFLSTDLVFDRDLNFDGMLVAFSPVAQGNTRVTLRGGAFPLDFGSFDYPSTSITKQKYPSKWLFAGQLEAGTEIGGVKVAAAAGFYHFRNVQGQLSAPCLFNGATVGIGTNDPAECSTDGSRASFLRKGNTLFFIRDIVVPAPDTLPASNRQFLGLTYKYSLLDVNGSVTVPVGGIDVTLQGNYVRNLAFKHRDECRYGVGPNGIPFTNVIAVNGNENPCSAVSPAKMTSGNQGYLVRLTVGNPKPRKWGEWNFMADYRYLQSDAVLDSLTDSDFHLGGTNAKGYTIAGTLGLADGISLTGRWMSANEITGRPLSIDVFQIDLSAEF